jgi:hypothetical protein
LVLPDKWGDQMNTDVSGVDPLVNVTALLNTFARFAASLRPEQAQQIIKGDAKIALMSAGQQVVDPLVGLDQALKILRGLSDEDREDLASKSAKLVLQRPGQRLVSTEPKAKAAPLDLVVIATEIEALPSEDAVVKYLADDKRLTAAVLVQLCKRMNVVVPTGVKTKPALHRLLAEEVIGHRRRTLGY